ncbi:MAG: peptidoglycan-binding protein [Methylacidiphilales bacterium]|nr:peptidoglycan-binding protein [Candidatus Methylacidiphilales bacterium]
MKSNYKSCLTLIAGLAILLPLSALAKDNKSDDNQQDNNQGKNGGGGQKHEEKAAQPQNQKQAAAPSRVTNTHNQAKANNAGGGRNHANRETAQVQKSNALPVASQDTQQGKRRERSQANQTQASSSQQANTRRQDQAQVVASRQTSNKNFDQTQVASTRHESSRSQNQVQASHNQRTFNRSNNFGGLWFSANTHSDWSRSGEHRWNNHDYRWYQGGWLIIDGGFSPYFGVGDSTVGNVQLSLSDLGYYHGPIDGDIGPGTRNAIADYQNDHDLRITGRINDPLLESLQLE